MTAEQLAKCEAAKKANPGIGRDRLAKVAGISESQARAFLGGKAGVKASAPPANKHGKSLTEFRSVYDKSTIIPAKIKAGLKMIAGGWEYESAFVKLCGISQQDVSNFREQFADNVVALKDNKRAWAATPALAKQMREML
jgi:hypothetical protein